MSEPFSRAYFRADGDASCGLGHLYRCLNLARELKRDLACGFLMNRAPESFMALLAAEGIEGCLLDSSAIAEARTRIERQVIVLDRYEIDTRAMSAWRRRGNIVAVIDDLAQGYFDCDLIISPGPQNREAAYSSRAGCRLLVGPTYALLHPAFYEQPPKPRIEVRRAFTSFGGGDAGNATRLALEALEALGLDVDVVLGAAYPHHASLARWRKSSRITLHSDLDQWRFAALANCADAALTSGGVTSLELCALGVPTLLVSVAANQVRPCEAFEAARMACYAGRAEDLDAGALRAKVASFLSDLGLRRAIQETNRTMFIESGARRTARALMELLADKKGRA